MGREFAFYISRRDVDFFRSLLVENGFKFVTNKGLTIEEAGDVNKAVAVYLYKDEYGDLDSFEKIHSLIQWLLPMVSEEKQRMRSSCFSLHTLCKTDATELIQNDYKSVAKLFKKNLQHTVSKTGDAKLYISSDALELVNEGYGFV